MAGRTAVNLSTFRKSFEYASKDLTRYFPGHMHKGMKQMQNKLKDVDCILEVHDARIPFSGRNPRFQDVLSLRPHVLVLNKIDLADLRHKDRIEEKLKSQGVSQVMYTNCKDQIHHTIKRVMIPLLVDTIESSPRYHRSDAGDYSLLVIGVPNVGKSSLINALRRTHLKKGRATSVGAISGITRSVLERIKINESPKIYVIDSPGILTPNVPDVEAGMKLALCATHKDHLVGEDVIVDYMLYWLNKHHIFRYVKHFDLPHATDDVYELLAWVAKKHNLTVKQRSVEGGYVIRPNFSQAAQIILKAFREGQLGRVNLDCDEIPQVHEER